MKVIRRFLSLPIPILPLILFTSCLPSEKKADFTFLNGTEPESLDPAIITGQPEGRVVQALFEGLLSRNPKGELVPGMADRWEVSPDGKNYRFHIRTDARWNNGESLTSRDFLLSWKRTLSPDTASEYAYQLYYVSNAESFNSGKLTDFSQVGVRAPDPSTLEVTLDHPTPFFLDLCAFPTLMPVHLPSIEKYGDEWIKPGHLISNGAYRLKEWRINDKIRIEGNPFYWDKDHVHSKIVDILPTSQANTAFNFYHSGKADLILDKSLVPSMLLEEMKGKPDFHSSPFLGSYFYRFNVTRKPFDDARVRKAFALVIDKQTLVEKITRAGEQIADSLVPPGIPGYQSPSGLARNPELARQLLTEAGFPGGKDFPSVSILYNSKSEQNEGIATEIQQMLKKELGIHVSLAQQEWKVYLNTMSSLDYDICRSSWVGDYNDPNTFMDMFVTGGGNNRTGWSNPAYDALIREAGAELNPEKRKEIFQKAEKILCAEEFPIIPLYYYVGIQFYKPSKITGLEPNVIDEHPLKYIQVHGK